MKLFFDENLGIQLVLGLRGFGEEEVIHLTEIFDKGTKDVDWLPYVGQNGYTLITVDKNIRRRPQERGAFLHHNVGAIFLAGKSMSRWNRIQQIVRAWHKIEAIVDREQPPFAFILRRSGRELDPLQLG